MASVIERITDRIIADNITRREARLVKKQCEKDKLEVYIAPNTNQWREEEVNA